MSRIKAPALMASASVLAVALSFGSLVAGSGTASADPQVCVNAPFTTVDWNNGCNRYDRYSNYDRGRRCDGGCDNRGCGGGCGGGYRVDVIAEWWSCNRGVPPWPYRTMDSPYGPVNVQDFQPWRPMDYNDFGGGNMQWFYR